MFGIGFGELLVIGALLLMAVGPRRMPVMMKSFGRAMREFRKATRELRAQVGLDELMAEDDVLMKSSPTKLRPVPAAKAAQVAPTAPVAVAAATREYPPEGVDVAESTAAPGPKVGA